MTTKEARKFIVQYIYKAHQSIVDALLKFTLNEPDTSLGKLSVAVAIERTLWDDFKVQLKAVDLDPMQTYCQIVDQIVQANIQD